MMNKIIIDIAEVYMKKQILFLISVSLLFSTTACGNSNVKGS